MKLTQETWKIDQSLTYLALRVLERNNSQSPLISKLATIEKLQAIDNHAKIM